MNFDNVEFLRLILAVGYRNENFIVYIEELP